MKSLFHAILVIPILFVSIRSHAIEEIKLPKKVETKRRTKTFNVNDLSQAQAGDKFEGIVTVYKCTDTNAYMKTESGFTIICTPRNKYARPNRKLQYFDHTILKRKGNTIWIKTERENADYSKYTKLKKTTDTLKTINDVLKIFTNKK